MFHVPSWFINSFEMEFRGVEVARRRLEPEKGGDAVTWQNTEYPGAWHGLQKNWREAFVINVSTTIELTTDMFQTAGMHLKALGSGVQARACVKWLTSLPELHVQGGSNGGSREWRACGDNWSARMLTSTRTCEEPGCCVFEGDIITGTGKVRVTYHMMHVLSPITFLSIRGARNLHTHEIR